MKKEKKQLTGVDCSGLVNLCYRVHGIVLPRNSKSQYQKSKKIVSHPRPADLLFLARKKSAQDIFHVMLYLGNDQLIEARGADVRKVRMTTGKKCFGKPIHKLKSGDRVGRGYIFFGRALSL